MTKSGCDAPVGTKPRSANEAEFAERGSAPTEGRLTSGSRSSRRLEALIFDVDGTLADTERDGHRVAFNRAFRDADLDWLWDVDLYGRLLAVGGGEERIRNYCRHFLADTAAADRWTPERIRDLHAVKTRYYTEMIDRGEIPLRPGVGRLINEARTRSVRLAVATTTTPVNATRLITNAFGEEAMSWFDVIAAGDDVPAKKPASDVYLRALERLGLDAVECLAFEDSQIGLRAAKGAGLRTVVTITEYTRWQNLGSADMVVDHLGEPDRPFRLLPLNAEYSRTRETAGDATLFDLALGERVLAA